MSKLDDPKFLKELNALQTALVNPLLTETEEKSINSKIKELIRKEKGRRGDILNIINLLNKYSPKDQAWILSGVLEQIGMGGTLYGYLSRDEDEQTVKS